MIDQIRTLLIAVALTACGTVIVPSPPDAGDDAIEDIADASEDASEGELVDAVVGGDDTDADADLAPMIVEISSPEVTDSMYQVPTYYASTDELAVICDPSEVVDTQFKVPTFSIPQGTRIESVTFTCRASEGGKCSLSLYDDGDTLISGTTENNLSSTWALPLTLSIDMRPSASSNFYLYGFMECAFGTTMMGKVTLYLSPAQ